MRSIAKVKSTIREYEIKSVKSLKDIINCALKPNTITFIDSNVAKLYRKLNHESFIIVDSTETIKTISGAEFIFDELLKRKANSKTHLVVIGGGILQDLIGYCASTYCRGISYTLVPTTLLAQADSCVGGKTSLNHGSRKNILGTFYPPSEILIYSNFTKTLTTEDYISGLGEIYKFYILQNKLSDFDPNKNIEDMVIEGLKYKIGVISKDEFDRGERRFLNFGHTFGHALEITSDYTIPHGIAVVIGSMIASKVSFSMNYQVPQYNLLMEKGMELIRKSNILINSQWFEFSRLLEIAKSDKKSSGNLTMVLMNNSPLLTEVNDIDIVRQSIKELQCEFQTSLYNI